MTTARTGTALAREAGAGATLGLITATQSLVHGLIAFGTLGPEAASLGIAAALAASAAVGLVVASLSATRPLAAGTSAITALVTASFLAAAAPASLAEAMALAMLLAGLAGLLVLAASAAGLGRLAGLVPAPVTIGLVNAGVVLILLGQTPLALGLQPGEGLGAAPLHPGSLLVGLAAAAVMSLRLRIVPSSVVALAGGTAVHQALTAAGIPLGLTIGNAPTPPVLIAGIGAALQVMPQLLAQEGLAARLLPAALSLAVLVVLEAVVGITAMRDRTGRRADERRDLLSVGAGCLAAALAGGFPGTVLGTGSLAFWRQGGRGRPGLILRAAVCLACIATAGPVIAALPFAALAGTLIGYSLPMFVWRPLLPRRGPGFARRAADALMIAVIVVGGVFFGLAAAIGIGVLLSVIVFTGSMAQSVIRRSIRGPVGRSRVLDLERVTRIDTTGGQRLAEACRAGGRVLVAPLHPGARAAAELAAIGLGDAVPAASAWPTVADALEAAEDALLATLRGDGEGAGRAGEEALAALGLPAEAIGPVLSRMQPCRFAPGEQILRAGEASDAAYLLLSGQTLVSLPQREGGPATRLAVLAPGTVFGELALLGAERRTADVTARGEVLCLRLAVSDAHALRAENPDAAWHLLIAVARQTAANLTAANAALNG